MSASRRMIQMCCLAVPCAVIALMSLMAQRSRPLELSVIDGRPLAVVIGQLETRYGWTITYQDPPDESPFDVDDVTWQVVDRSVLETVELVVAQVRERTGAPLVIGRLPTNLLSQKKLRTGATNEPARNVLVRARCRLTAISAGGCV